jgi:DNA polymerase-3 subunit delta
MIATLDGCGRSGSLRYRDEEQQRERAQRVKLSLDTLGTHLAQSLLPIYLVSGDEPLLVGEASDAIRAQARIAGFSERQVFFIERAAAVWEDIRQQAQALSLFAALRMVEIRMPGGKPGTAGAAALKRLFEAAGSDLLVLIITAELDRDAQGADWVAGLQQRGAWLPIRTVERSRLPQWLKSRFAAQGLKATEDAIALLADRSEGNLLAARQEIDKLALLLPRGSTVSLAEVEAGSADSARFDVFQLTDAVRSADPARALRVLGGLNAEGSEPPLVLWALSRELKGMQMRAGASSRIPFARLIARAARADRMAKGLSTGDAWDELALLVVEMTGKRTLPLIRTGTEA